MNSLENQNIRRTILHQEPKFGGNKSVIFFFICIILLFVVFYAYNTKDTVVGIIVVLVLPLAFVLMLDIQGFEFDSENKKIRKFHKIFSIKYGKWTDISEFHSILLKRDVTKIQRSKLSIAGGFDEFLFYSVCLTPKNEWENNIVIKDFKRMEQAVPNLIKWAEITGLPVDRQI
jgi:hypothetical protein